MKPHDIDYKHTTAEIEAMRRLLVKSYAVSLKPFNWRLAMLENWIFGSRYLEAPEFFLSRVHLWNNPAGDLVAFVVRGTNFIHIQVDYEYRFLEDEIFDWAERNMPGDAGQMSAMVYDWDIERQQMLARRGYQNLSAIEDLRIYDLRRTIPQPALPEGFRFSTVAECGDIAGRIELENRVWGVSLNQAWFRGKSSSPSYSLDWDLLVVSPEGRQAAFNLVWLYPENKTAEIDPLGTDPDFRQRGLAKALLLESFRRMQAQGICYAYIGSEAADDVVSRLYASLGPVESYQRYHWRKG